MDGKSKPQTLELNEKKRRVLLAWVRRQIVTGALTASCMFCETRLNRPGDVICGSCARGPEVAALRVRQSGLKYEEVLERIKTLASWLRGLSQDEFLQFIQREKLSKFSIPNKEGVN